MGRDQICLFKYRISLLWVICEASSLVPDQTARMLMARFRKCPKTHFLASTLIYYFQYFDFNFVIGQTDIDNIERSSFIIYLVIVFFNNHSFKIDKKKETFWNKTKTERPAALLYAICLLNRYLTNRGKYRSKS